jgi:hypothetical protein
MIRLPLFFIFLLFLTNLCWSSQVCDSKFHSYVETSQSFSDDLIAKKRDGLQIIKRIDGQVNGQDIHFISGVPEKVKRVKADELGVIRHYSKENIDQIVASGKLIAGPRPYIIPDAHLRQEFVDINGIFFTKTDFNPKDLWLGMDHRTPYVDFKVHSDTGILYLADGNYIIPGPPSKPQWYVNAYNEYIQTGNAPAYLVDEFQRLRNVGGIKPTLEVEIEIINVFKP